MAAVLLAAFVPALPASAYQRPGTTELVSAQPSGAEADGGSGVPAISADGRYVAFRSLAGNLVPGDTNDTADIFVRDRVAGTIERISVATDGTEANGTSHHPAISADGRFVAYESVATNLVPDIGTTTWNLFLRDRQTGVTERISATPEGADADGSSVTPVLSADGRYVAFTSAASNLVADDTNDEWDVFVLDRESGTFERASVGSDGAEISGKSGDPAISADGRFVAFRSISTILEGGEEGQTDVFVLDRDAGTLERVSVRPDGGPTNEDSRYPALSADGRYVAFISAASNLVPVDANRQSDVFVYDRVTGTTERVSVDSYGRERDRAGGVFQPSLSADGRLIAFRATSRNLIADDTNDVGDIFVHDRVAATTERVSVATDGAEANAMSPEAALSADGRFVAFASDAWNLVPGDTNGESDVFVRERGGPLTAVGELSVQTGQDSFTVSGAASMPGTPIAGATDPDDDAASTGDMGEEITGAEVVYRPEEEDLLFRVAVTDLPLPFLWNGTPWFAGTPPAMVYGVEFEVGGSRYEARATREGLIHRWDTVYTLAKRDYHDTTRAALYRCDTVCGEEGTLTASFGWRGAEVLISLPLVGIGAQPETSLQELRVFAGLGDAAAGSASDLDDVALPDAVLPPSRAELAIAPASTPADQVTFDDTAAIIRGEFTGTLNTAALPAGNYRVWARVCTGPDCGPPVGKQVTL